MYVKTPLTLIKIITLVYCLCETNVNMSSCYTHTHTQFIWLLCIRTPETESHHRRSTWSFPSFAQCVLFGKSYNEIASSIGRMKVKKILICLLCCYCIYIYIFIYTCICIQNKAFKSFMNHVFPVGNMKAI